MLCHLGYVIIKYDEVAQISFSMNNVWRHYKYPEELDVMLAHGATHSFLQEKLLDRLEEGDIWYAIDSSIFIPTSPFMRIGVSYSFANRSQPGYLTTVDRDITSGTFFSPEVWFSASEVLADENLDSLAALSTHFNIRTLEVLPIRYKQNTLQLGNPIPHFGILDIALP